MNSREKGRIGEMEACKYLEGRGYSVIARNYRTLRGEIDIIARNNQTINFIEVKKWDKFTVNDLEYSINRRKRDRIINTALHFMMKNAEYGKLFKQFDIIFINKKIPEFLHIKEAFGIND